jgi:RsiW-degrading membrane proteinase PrsW (M82 family)
MGHDHLPEQEGTPAPENPTSGKLSGMPPSSDLLPLGDWVRHDSLRSWPVLLFLALICIPSCALVILGASASANTFTEVAWIFAAYFALAWLLLLGVIVRPAHVTRPMLALIIVAALLTEIPLAVALEGALHDSNGSLTSSIFTIGVPEELAKALPIVIVALIYRTRHRLAPRDYLFLGAVSGLVFGASEVVRYFTINGVAEFYLTVQSALPTVGHLIRAGNTTATALFAALIGPVLDFILNFVWRFLTDPISHACWSGLTGYFIGLAVKGRYKWYAVAWIGLAAAALLHGLNDWSQVNGHVVWILVTLVSGVLFLGYAKVGSRTEGTDLLDAEPPPFLDTRAAHARHVAGRPSEPAGRITGDADQRTTRPWWEQHLTGTRMPRLRASAASGPVAAGHGSGWSGWRTYSGLRRSTGSSGSRPAVAARS